jgi:hypothetical protein
MKVSVLPGKKSNYSNKVALKLQYKSLILGREEKKFEDWIMTIEDRWLDEIAACLEGNFPDWRE